MLRLGLIAAVLGAGFLGSRAPARGQVASSTGHVALIAATEPMRELIDQVKLLQRGVNVTCTEIILDNHGHRDAGSFAPRGDRVVRKSDELPWIRLVLRSFSNAIGLDNPARA